MNPATWLINFFHRTMSENIPIATIGGVKVYRDGNSVRWTSRLSIDADGSPQAYHPDSASGLDRIANAGKPGNWFGIAVGRNGQPFIQGVDAPAFSKFTEGFYVSTTALVADKTRLGNDPRRYTNSETVPYIVVPGAFVVSGLLGKKCVVTNTANGMSCDAIVADIGPRDSIGEGSIALAKSLGINPDCRTGGVDSGIQYTVLLA